MSVSSLPKTLTALVCGERRKPASGLTPDYLFITDIRDQTLVPS